ncbi:MAG: hypothetical protein R3Y11_07415 [Pseudomonadota bacterium]
MPTFRDKIALSEDAADQQLYRFFSVTACRTCEELAAFLGISVGAVQRAVKKVRNGGDFPEKWLFFLLRVKSVHPEWVLTGYGSCYIYITPEGQYETGNASEERMRIAAALCGIPSTALTEEILRRIARM